MKEQETIKMILNGRVISLHEGDDISFFNSLQTKEDLEMEMGNLIALA